MGYAAAPDFADFDGDGDLDAFIGDGYGRTYLFANTGTATAPAFAAPSTDAFGLTDVGDRASPDLADIDADGDLDVLVGDQTGQTRVFSNFPPTTPVFATTTSFGLADVGQSAAPDLADIDDDGDLDAFIGNQVGETIFFVNAGTAGAPAFAAASTNPFGLTDVGDRAAPVLVDIDNDGDLDAFVGESGGNTFFFRNTGTAAEAEFGAASTNPFGLTDVGVSAAPALADIDRDGDLDVFTGAGDGNTLFRRNTGTAAAPAFGAASTNPFGLSDVGASAAPDLADIDGDGDLDALIGEGVGGSTIVRMNTGTSATPAFGAASINPFGLAGVAAQASPTLADIDGDHDLDVFIGDSAGSTAVFTNPIERPVFASPSTNPFGLASVYFLGRGSGSPDLADIDGDGDLDAFVGNKEANTVFFRNTGTAAAPAFAVPSTNPFGLTRPVLGAYHGALDFADLDGDGDLDLFVGISDGSFHFFRNTGTATTPAFAAPSANPFGLSNVFRYASPDLADIDGDGDLDALVGTGGSGFFYSFVNTGTGTAPAFTGPNLKPFGLVEQLGYAAPELADIDVDGDLDLFIGHDFNVDFQRNVGTALAPMFGPRSNNPFGLASVDGVANPALADIDGDGDLDAVVGSKPVYSNDSNLVVLANISGLPSARARPPAPPPTRRSPARPVTTSSAAWAATTPSPAAAATTRSFRASATTRPWTVARHRQGVLRGDRLHRRVGQPGHRRGHRRRRIRHPHGHRERHGHALGRHPDRFRRRRHHPRRRGQRHHHRLHGQRHPLRRRRQRHRERPGRQRHRVRRSRQRFSDRRHGHDTLSGGEADDLLKGGRGRRCEHGKAGSDTATYRVPTAAAR